MSKSKMITLPREVVERALEAMSLALSDVDWRKDSPTQPVIHKAYNATSAALKQPQPDQAPYLYYDPENGDTWTQEAIDEGFSPNDNLIALYTK